MMRNDFLLPLAAVLALAEGCVDRVRLLTGWRLDAPLRAGLGE